MLRAGAFEVCITPPLGVEMAGYGPDLGRYAMDIHDHLMGQALVLDDGQTQIAIVTSDLLGVTSDFTQTVRQEVQQRTGIPAGNILVSASHPHTSVTLMPTRSWGSMDRPYMRMAARHLAGAVVGAFGKLQPARFSAGHGEYHELAWNRTGTNVVDPSVNVIRVDTADGKPLALLALHACHPVILGPKPVFSADYPGALRRYLAGRHPGSVILFANGTCGDVDPVTNRAVWGQGTFDDVERAGTALGKVVDQIASQAAPLDSIHFHTRQTSVELHYDIPSLDTIREQIKLYAAEARNSKGSDAGFGAPSSAGQVTMPRFWLGYYRTLEKRIATGNHPAYATAELQAFAFDHGLAIVAMPAEVYAAQGLAIRAGSPFQYTLPICYANGAYGYLPPRAEFERSSYTASLAAAVHDRAPYRSDVAEVLVESVDKLLRDVGPQG